MGPLNLVLAVTERTDFVDIDVAPSAWVVLLVCILALLGLDLWRHRKAHAPTGREALLESSFWVVCGLTFGAGIWAVFGSQAGGEYLAGYLVEKSLSVDNVFVWALIFSTMKIPVKYQHRVLFWGIFGALTLRALFIAAGAALIERFAFTLIVFGVFLLYTGVKVIRHRDDEGEEGTTRGVGLLRKIMPVTDSFDGQRFTTRLADGRRAATPLLAALVVVEFTDIVFAVDSVPAILAVSQEPYLVFASNAFAILGLRAMYFLLADARQRFHYLSHALGAILVFVGFKMIIAQWYHVPTFASLGVIVAILAAAVLFSIRKANAAEESELAVTSERV